MPLREGFDIKLERVVTAGLPRNRAEWCYTLTIPTGRHRRVCIDFDGHHDSFTDPGNFDARSATDSDRMAWGGVKKVRKDKNRPNRRGNRKTLICLKAKDEKQPFEGGEIELCFIGPGDSAGASSVSIETNSFVQIKNSNRGGWGDLDHGRKSGVEAPLFAVAPGDDLLEDELFAFEENEPLVALGMSPPPEALLITEAGDFVVTAMALESTIDFSEPLALAEPLLLSEMARLPISTVRELSEEQAAAVAEVFGASTLGELLQRPPLRAIGRLAGLIGG